MGMQRGYSFDRIYEDYLHWFHEKARSSAVPKEKEELLQYQIGHEDVFENSTTLLNRMFFFIPLLPSESNSGRPELFIISELNLMKKDDCCDEVEEVIPVEYFRYTL